MYNKTMNNHEALNNKRNDEMDNSDPYGFSSLEGIAEVDFKKVTYEELMTLTDKRYFEGRRPTLTEHEARAYYGEKCCDLLTQIFEFCRGENYTIYQHATSPESANNIMQKGFIVYQDDIDSIPDNILKNNPIAVERDEEGVRTFIYDGDKCKARLSGISDELSDTQHFFANTSCRLDYGDLTDPPVSRNTNGYGATLLFVVSNEVEGSREYEQYGVVEPHYDDWNDEEVEESFFERRVVPRQFCIGYLDVENRRFVANSNFRFNYGVEDGFVMGYESTSQHDLFIQLMNNADKKEL